MKEKETPLIVCYTSNKNYGWVINAFLKANSLWADYIIIVDQMSTDGCREIYKEYPNVIVVDDHEEDYSETRRSILGINRAREIPGDKIFVNLAIDEVLPANVKETEGWQQIINSEPGQVFFLKWANLLSDRKTYVPSSFWMARIFHDDGVTPFDNFGRDMHTINIPYPKEIREGQEVFVEDLPLLHFDIYNEEWYKSKLRFYYFVDFDKNNRNTVSLFRTYYYTNKIRKVLPIQKKWIYTKKSHDFDLYDEVLIQGNEYLDQRVKTYIEEKGSKYYQKLDVWDADFLTVNALKDPRNIIVKLLHFYLRKTQGYTNNILIRVMDKVLKKIT